MKVLEINSVSGCGSTGRIASDIAKELERQGHEVVIAYGRDWYYHISIGIKSWIVYNNIKELFDMAINQRKYAEEIKQQNCEFV